MIEEYLKEIEDEANGILNTSDRPDIQRQVVMVAHLQIIRSKRKDIEKKYHDNDRAKEYANQDNNHNPDLIEMYLYNNAVIWFEEKESLIKELRSLENIELMSIKDVENWNGKPIEEKSFYEIRIMKNELIEKNSEVAVMIKSKKYTGDEKEKFINMSFEEKREYFKKKEFTRGMRLY
ncbi:MAG: hypothetical protein HPY53_11200 [Brevinematales bacterium]|nr:hypothetical protein [Brevinematales bacterium]